LALESKMRGLFFDNLNWSLNRCLAPDGKCNQKAIHAHSVQNAQAMGLLARDGHVKALRLVFPEEGAPFVRFEDVGRNEASTFEGFCSAHDSNLFIGIDSYPLDRTNAEQLFLFAYRAIARETLAVMEAASKMQSAYQQRVAMGLDTGQIPEPAGMNAIAHAINAYETWKYKRALDKALLARRFSEVLHDVVSIEHRQACIAVSSCFSLEDRRQKEDIPDEDVGLFQEASEDDRIVRVTLNLLPISKKESIVIFSYIRDDADRVREFLRPVLDSHECYQKYLLSKLILMHCENFVIAPDLFDQWSGEKRDAISSFFLKKLHRNAEVEDKNLFLF
jgi:hypothetical protein